MSADDLESRIRALIVHQTGVSPAKLTAETDVVDDLRIYGDDVWELFEAFGKQFSVRVDGFRWYHHTGPEGFNLLWLLFKPWWARKTHVPVRLSDLVASAQQGVWAVRYPEHERQA